MCVCVCVCVINPTGKEKNENGRWGGGLLSRGRPKERRIHDEFPEDFDYWQRLESHDRSKRDDTHCNIGDSDSRKLPYLHSNMKVPKPLSQISRNGGLAQLLPFGVGSRI